MGFAKDFMWGAASAAYQVEGAYNEDGRGMGIWDALSEGHVKHGDNGNVASDHYHRYKEDVAIMKRLGLKAYRFSVSWPRIQPQEGKRNEKGIRFYQNLVQELLDAGITPMCTLFHWNLPVWLHEKGGWRNPKISEYFAEYTRIVVEALSHKVVWWMTVNEPLSFLMAGYIGGIHAPFERLENPEDFRTVPAELTKNMLLAHGRAVETIRAHALLPPHVGVALNGDCYSPWEETEEDIREAREKTFGQERGFTGIRWWADPMILGTAPAALAESISPEEMAVICQPLDFLGYNCYNGANYNEPWEPGTRNPHVYPGQPRTAMDWPMTPEILYWAARFFHERYGLPVLITENGMANLDFVMSDGRVHDPQRIEFLKGYLKGVKRAVEEGIPVIGYLYWSILDNFEWAEGYDKRFGLVYVDYRTQERTLKDSALWYAGVIAENGNGL